MKLSEPEFDRIIKILIYRCSRSREIAIIWLARGSPQIDLFAAADFLVLGTLADVGNPGTG
jgi:hypothetical protein